MAMIDVKNALNMLQKALPMIPMGAPAHTEILSFVKKMAEHLTSGEDDKGLQLQSLLQMARQGAQQPPLAALARMYGGGQNTPPAMPQAPQSPATAAQ